MKLSDKYVLKEDNFNINLYEIVDSKVKQNGIETGEVVKKEKLVGYYSPSGKGRAQVYRKVINKEISALEVQSLENIIDIVDKTSSEIIEWFEGQTNA